MNRTDHFGLKNLYYLKPDSNKTHQSIRDMIEHSGFTDYSPEGIVSFFFFRYPILTNTMFHGYGRYDTGYSIDEQKYYWKPSFDPISISINDAVETVDKLLIEAISKSIGDAKKIGATLSGGIDSSLLVAMIKTHFPDRELFTYSSGFDGLNEFPFSSQVAKLYSDKHDQITITKEEFLKKHSVFEGLIREKCAPVHPNEVALTIAGKHAIDDGCDLIVCGEGADEIFGGYGQLLRMPVNYRPDKDKSFFDYFLSNYLYFQPGEVKEILADKYYFDGYSFASSVFKEQECPNIHENQIFYFLQRIHGRGLIERFDNTFRYLHIPGAFPFIDSHLVDFVNSLPFEYKVAWKDNIDVAKVNGLHYKEISEAYDIPKYILKLVAEKYLPRDVVYRNKVAFPVPYEDWLAADNDIILNSDVFKIRDLSGLSGWKKFMLMNLNTFVDIFNEYRR